MAEAIPPTEFIEFLALLPSGVLFHDGIAKFCNEFGLKLEESEPEYASGSGNDFGFRAKMINSASSSHTVFMRVEAADEHAAQTAREMIEERSKSAFAEVILVGDSVGERRTLEAYQLLNELENMLRKLVAVRLASLSHQNWWSTRVTKCLSPGRGGKFKYEDYRDNEVNNSEITPKNKQDQHDLFYLDLSELKKVIEDADNWRDGFAGDLKTLTSIERLDTFNQLRRKVAHNRFLSHRNLEDLKQLHANLTRLCRRVFGI